MYKYYFLYICLTLVSGKLFSQAPDINYYSQMGFNAGYAYGKIKNAPSVGVVHGTVIGSYWFYEASAVKLAFFNEQSQTSKLLALDLLMMDMGFGYSSENLLIGVSPFSINLTQSPCFGLAVVGKCRIIKQYVAEVKLVPVLYGKPENYGLFNNNFYAGIHYWFSEKFSLGLRYNRYNYYGNFSLMASWNFLEIN